MILESAVLYKFQLGSLFICTVLLFNELINFVKGGGGTKSANEGRSAAPAIVDADTTASCFAL